MVMPRQTNQPQEGLPPLNLTEVAGMEDRLPSNVSTKAEQRVDRLITLMGERFQQDDDATTVIRRPWTRESFYHGQSHELLSVVAVLAGVKPAALIDESSFLIPEVRAAVSRLAEAACASTIIESCNVKSLVVGEPSRVLEIMDVFREREILIANEQDIPDHNFRRLGVALGYSERAIEYFLMRNSAPVTFKKR